MKSLGPALLVLFILAACSPAGGGPASTQSSIEDSSAEASSFTSDVAAKPLDATRYAGLWTGPEGTAMTLKPAGDGIDITIRNLDGPRKFSGTLQADGIHFIRDGKPLIIHRGNGDETGMKWLAGKQDCMVVDANEGYCRD